MNTTAEGSRSTGTELLSRLPISPDIYPQKVEFVRQAVLLLRIDAKQYLSASFLDDRMLSPGLTAAWVPAAQIVDAARRASSLRPLHFIFHAGHVGSTLLSRLLDETRIVLSLREPAPLRTLAEAHDQLGRPDALLGDVEFAGALDAFTRLWSRGYDTTQCVVLKATSSAGRLAQPLLARNAGARAVYLNLGAEPFLATLLAGDNSLFDLRGHGPERMRRLLSLVQAKDATPPLHQLSIGPLAAMSWLAESLTQHHAIARFPDRVLAMDFDHMLANVPEAVARVASHFGLPLEARALEAIARSPVLTRYAKAPEHAYSPQLRAQILAQSRQNNTGEIAKGMAWLERMARTDATVAKVLSAGT